ncbi:MAG: hypothetical protein ACREIJ_05560 [Nitrospiraceae bacterium]
MTTSKRAKNPPDEFFDSLVSNAIDFLSRSIADLKKRPKYSVINFCVGLEIFLKARLIKEHWALLVTKPETAMIDQFRAGDFHSVSMEDAIRRLKNVAGEKIGKDEEISFEQVRKHRNRLVHFFHPAYARKPDEKLIQQVVTEQCKAWFYLHRLLTMNWEIHFRKYKKRIEKLNELMHKQRTFLQAKFLALKLLIDTEISNGMEFKVCHFCGCRAARIKVANEPLRESSCFVCEARSSELRVPCPDCGENIEVGFKGPGEGTCPNEDCEREIDLEYLLEKYGPVQDPKEESEVIYCASCEHHEECVIPFDDGYLCLCCAERHDFEEQCHWCGNHIAGFDPAGSAAFGCFMCSDAIPWDRR